MENEFDPMVDENNENTAADCVESEEENISDSFVCCVCLDLLYKPIVLACGHVSCFWCVHRSMNALGESNCPICRHPYHHFPTVCQMLHFLIIKMYPIAYRRRENQTLEEEKKTGFFSPQFEGSFLQSNSVDGSELSSGPSSKTNPSIETPENSCQSQDSNMVVTKENNQSQTDANGTLNQISITDALCPACKQLLIRPAVLNCGHAYCEACITIPEDEVIICQICKSPHPTDFPKVCLELNNFLEETFPKEYASRRDSNKRKRDDLQQKSPPACSSSTKSGNKGAYPSFFPAGDLLPWLTEHGPKFHQGVGCDYCGMYPIVGHRYRCKDCKEAMGFDLCGDCYNTQSKLPGRFNQQHTADHKFELIKISHLPYSWMLNLATASFGDGSIVISTGASEDSEDGSTLTGSPNNPPQNNNNNNNNTEDPAEPNNNTQFSP